MGIRRILEAFVEALAEDFGVVSLVVLIEACWMSGYGVLTPIMNDLMMTDLTGTTGMGAIESVANTVGLLATPVLGRFSDLRGRRSSIIVGVLFGVLSCGLFIAAHMVRVAAARAAIALILCGRIVDQLSGGLSPTLRAYMSDCSTRDKEDTAALNMGRIQAAMGFGLAFGFFCGGFLGERHGCLPPLYVSMATVLVAAALAFALPPRASATAATTAAEDAPSPWTLLREAAQTRAVVVLLALRFIMGVAFSVYFTTDQNLLKERLGIGPKIYGMLMFTTGMLFSCTNALLVPKLTAVFSLRTTLIIGLLALAVARAVQACAVTLFLAIAGAMIVAAGGGITGTLIASLLADLSPPDRRGLLLGLSESIDKATGIFSPLLGGLLYDGVAPAAPASLACALSLLACATAAVGLPSSSQMSGTKSKAD